MFVHCVFREREREREREKYSTAAIFLYRNSCNQEQMFEHEIIDAIKQWTLSHYCAADQRLCFRYVNLQSLYFKPSSLFLLGLVGNPNNIFLF